MENKITKLLDENNYISFWIEPRYSLSQTAGIIEKLFVNISLEVNDSYDEYPAFVGYYKGYKFRLLGIPAEEDVIHEDAPKLFQLQIFHRDANDISELKDVSELFAEQFTDLTGLKSEVHEL